MTVITAIGELLIDFTPAGQTIDGTPLLAMNPGGAPANVLACVSKLGESASFIGMVGSDPMGDYLETCLRDLGIGTQGLSRSAEAGTTLAFVHLDSHGNRSFSFRRNPGADQRLKPENVGVSALESCHVFHFGSLSLTHSPSRETVLDAVRRAKALGKLICYDPNYRPALWDSPDDARRWMKEGALLSDIIKLSEEELPLLTGTADLQAGAAALLGRGCSLVFVTRGRDGAFFCTEQTSGHVPAYDVETIDTTGAGDCFLGAALVCLSQKSPAELRTLTKPELRDITGFASAAASLSTTKSGAIRAMPSREEITALLRQGRILT